MTVLIILSRQRAYVLCGFYGIKRCLKRFFAKRRVSVNEECIALVAYTLHFNYTEIMDMEALEFMKFVEISERILKAKNG
ncbi:MAG: hypothetical protein LBP54_06700 [Campylobacteraceae bacterium]|jgi:hypothetical protein|nr:hypothetical protein [Campylobacteraceae bacterium]